MLTLRVYRVYVFRYQNRVNFEVNSVSGKIRRFDRVNTREIRVNSTEFTSKKNKNKIGPFFVSFFSKSNSFSTSPKTGTFTE